jgi:bidirectional [NiFe] hydrogenase diaphorase subunit
METATPQKSPPSGAATDQAARDNREKLLERAMSRHHYSGDALIEVLHTGQELFGYLSRDLLLTVAEKLHLPPSRVLGVATFYHFFSLRPKGEHSIVVCDGTACYVAGSHRLLQALEQRCVKSGGTSPDGKVSVQSARCIGSCGLAPAVICDGRILPRVTEEALHRELDRIGVK